MKARIPDNSPLFRSFPELSFFDNKADREKAWDAATKGSGKLYVFAALVLMIAASFFTYTMNRYVMPYLQHWVWFDSISSGFLAGMAAVVSGMLVIRIRRKRIERSLRRQLVKRDRAICIACGYDLQGQTESRCPECGTAFDPKLLKSENTGAIHEQ